MKKLLLLFFLLPAISWLRAQDDAGDLRLDLEFYGQADAYYINPMGDGGLVLFYPTDSVNAFGERMWSFIRYTSDFTRIWDRQIMALPELNYAQHTWDQTSLHVLLMSEKPLKKRRIQIFSLNTETGDLEEMEGLIPYNLKLNDFSSVRNIAYIGGETQMTKFENTARTIGAMLVIPTFLGITQNEPEAVHYMADMNEKKFRQFRYDYNGVATIQRQAPNYKARSMSTVIYHSPTRKEDHLYLKEYAGDKLIRNLEVSPKSDRRILTGQTLHLNRDEFLVTGTYAQAYFRQKIFKRIGLFFSGQRLPPNANGIYIAKIGYRGQVFTEFYNFAEFENFWEVYKPKVKRKVKRKQKRKEKKGKEVILNFKLLMHDVIETEDTYLLVAEVYEEEYKREMVRDIRTGIMQDAGREYFAGYKYTHAIAAAFNKKDGKMIWDNSFPINNILSMNLEERVEVLPGPDSTIMIYSQGPYLQSRTIQGGEVLEPREIKKMTGEFSGGRIGFESDIVHWYDNYFLAWGYEQPVKEEEGLLSALRGQDKEKKPQRVFLYRIGY